MKISLKGFVLTDKDQQLIVRGTIRKKSTMSMEDSKQIPVLFAHKKQAERSLHTAGFDFSRSAIAYCKLYGVPHKDVTKLLRVTPCTITLDF